ncbi:MotA/TolQ/ExbB proton channel family protein [Adonisia turfae]|uniref:MotA/TolQ/ExbB proton channel family protein n=1 Tax=Adonisia turfae CCMR0081 TaxID=2292702 RepID=A0A6M0RV60_9CYAN|nr:MotA/TolQ/ExbB proton channel family protein [Adonisia turfae]NEZ59770.1 MotA/TolQ/ExbB proton channel family protein [Adonisia turfae CCMR0081]
MATVFDFLAKGGPVMVPIVGASVLTISCALERTRFWSDLLRREGKIVSDVLDAAKRDLNEAAAIANQHHDTPIGRFLFAPLRLNNASPETFRLAMETAADREFVKMRQGEKLLETIVAISPLLGLLGTVTGLIATFYSLDIGGSGGGEGASEAAAGIGEALITTAAGMVVAILALLVLRILVSLQSQQADYFSEAGNELELIYRQNWYEPALLASENGHSVEEPSVSATYQS